MTKLFPVFFVLLLISSVASAGNDPLGERLERALAPQIGPGKTAGAVVGVWKDGQAHFFSFGETVRGSGKKPAQDTLFAIASITKTFTSLILADAVTRGETTLDSQLSTMIPELSGQLTASITLKQLATHSSGLARLPCNMKVDDEDQPYASYTESDMLAGLRDGALKGPNCEVLPHPHTPSIYSNWGMATLGYALGRAKNATYGQVLKSVVTDPLGLRDTTIAPTDEQEHRRSKSYAEDGHELLPWKRQAMLGNGAIFSTADDLFAYLRAQLDPATTPLAAAITLTHKTQHQDSDGIHGLAWYKLGTEDDAPILHNGSAAGYRSYILANPKNKIGFFWLANSSRDLNCVAEAIAGKDCAR